MPNEVVADVEEVEEAAEEEEEEVDEEEGAEVDMEENMVDTADVIEKNTQIRSSMKRISLRETMNACWTKK